MEQVGRGVIYMQECDTCPQTLWATSATRTLDHLVMLALEGCKGGKVLVLAQPVPRQAVAYYNAAFFSKGYKAAMIRWLKLLGGFLPGGVSYLGVGPVMCEAGQTAEGESIVVLNALDLDGDIAPELMFDVVPAYIERLQGDGTWEPVAFEVTGRGVCRLRSPIAVQQPAIFRYRRN